jgi:hypothetical protein
MARQRSGLSLLLLVLAGPAAWGQSTLAPQAGVLALRNGQVIAGEVTRAGDYYVVTLGASGEIRLPAADVEALCGSLQEAYEFKLRRLTGHGARPHLDLADWCLRHNLFAQCAAQLVAAMRIAPEDERLKQLERRLTLAMEAPPADRAPAAEAAPAISAQELDEMIRALPKRSVEKFSATVQPILLNRCGANQCHGPNAASEYRLLRPPDGQLASRRFTQRNLHATLRYLDSANPEASPLVTMAQRRHGPALAAVFDKQTQHQLAELVSWAKITVAAPPPAPPAAALVAAGRGGGFARSGFFFRRSTTCTGRGPRPASAPRWTGRPARRWRTLCHPRPF